MTGFLLAALGLGAALLLWSALRRRAEGDGAWGVLVTCSRCSQSMPRWYYLDKGSARGPYSMYRYPIPTECRLCRHQKGIAPIRPRAGETERRYDARWEKIAADRFDNGVRR